MSYTKSNINIDDAKILTNLAENYSVFELSENYLAKNKTVNKNNIIDDTHLDLLSEIRNEINILIKNN